MLSQKLSPSIKGIIYMALGLILLLHTLGFLRGLNFILILLAIAIIAYGFMQAQVYEKVMSFIKKSQKKIHKNEP